MLENKNELLKNVDVILSLMNTDVAYKLQMSQLFYGEIIFIQKEYCHKIDTWLLKLFKNDYIQFTNATDIETKIHLFNQFTQQFHLPQLLTKLSRKKCELFEKLMLEELEKHQLCHNFSISIDKIKSGFLKIEDYLLPNSF